MVRPEKKVDAPVRVLRPGESMLVDRQIAELEIILFRPLCTNPVTPRRSEEVPNAPNVSKRPSNGSASASVESASRRETIGQQDTISKEAHGRGGVTPGVHAGTSTLTPATVDTATPCRPPLFFDTTACVFYNDVNKTDYVATGRTSTDSKGVRHRPHAVVVGNEPAPNGYCNYNIDEEQVFAGARSRSCSNVGCHPNGHGGAVDFAEDGPHYRKIPEATAVNSGVATAAGDGVEVNFRKLSLCSGLLVNASLFTKDTSLDTVRNTYYMVRKVKSALPICLVPICVPDGRYHSTTAVMLRRVRLHGESVWELSNVGEPLVHKDVKIVIGQLEKRGLRDPMNYTPDFDKRNIDGVDERGQNDPRADSDFIGDDEEDEESSACDDEDAEASPLPEGQPREFTDLLSNVPVIVREGRRQYNVGRPHVRGANAGDDLTTDEDDEILDDALRAVVPKYANGNLVRYDDGAYNVGSKPETLASHYIDHREAYGLESAAAGAAFLSGNGVPSAFGSVGDGVPFVAAGGAGTALPALFARTSMGAGLEQDGIARYAAPADRCRLDMAEAQRPPLPPEFMVDTAQRKERRRSGWGSHQRRATVATQKSSLSNGHKRSVSSKGRRRTGSAKRKSKSKAGSKKRKSAAGAGEEGTPSRSGSATATSTMRSASASGKRKKSTKKRSSSAARRTPSPGQAKATAATVA